MPDWEVYDWREEALCGPVGYPDAWFPGPGATGVTVRKVCDACPVKLECLMFAIENGEAYGIWGGLTEGKRREYAQEHGIPYRANWMSPDDDPIEGTAEVVELRDQGMTYAAIGERLGLHTDSVRERYHKARGAA